jgi:hypothetical protein
VGRLALQPHGIVPSFAPTIQTDLHGQLLVSSTEEKGLLAFGFTDGAAQPVGS